MLAQILTDATTRLAPEGEKAHRWLAKQMGVDRATAVRWLSGRRSPSPEHLLRLASVLGLDPLVLLTAKVAA